MLFVLFNNDKVIGCFDNKQALDLLMDGLKKNKLCKNLKFTCYHNNSICSTEYSVEQSVEQYTEENEEIIENEPKKELSEKDIEKQKKIEYNLNVLKQRKERIEESKRTFKVDLDLYNKFKKFKENDEKFEIPPLFQNKWDLMLQL